MLRLRCCVLCVGERHSMVIKMLCVVCGGRA